ncbi:MAG: gamma-glutamyltranspeptidase / glutathione hydrolase [Gaiellaceae bacterium]|jgi:gamma-glutamyltranspeptidase/glutathione hydrolase|nr:gamma-glutamyltranspeptidase / glutathione hydrolase [Gaiellaceae bacterium]
MRAAVAAGHPATVAAGVEILEDGGNAADAAVASALAACVAETVMTGLLGGGHAIYFDAASGRVRNLDCFVAVPGLGAEPRAPELIHLDVPFGAELVHYAVGPASCAVPGLPAGLVALSREHGRMPWRRLVEPALALARDGVAFPAAHAACLAMLAPVMTMNEGERIYAPGGELLRAGDRLEQPGLGAALEELAEDEATVYEGALADALLELLAERGGLITRADLGAYAPRWSEPVELSYSGRRLLTRADLSGLPETVPRLPTLRGLDETARVRVLVDALRSPLEDDGDTTNATVVDSDGNACVITSSLGLGSGDYLPGLDLHLNSMLGEADLLRGALEPGSRMHSMMAPTLAFRGEELELAAGAAGGTRLRTALLTVIAGILDEGLVAEAAVERPRFHPAPGVVNAEPGVDAPALEELEASGVAVRRWPAPHHYFGGVSVVSSAGAAGDPRRSGSATTLG